MSSHRTSNERTERPFVAGMVRKFSVLIILGWLAITGAVSFFVPSLEQVAKERAVSLSSKDAPSIKAMMRIGELFKESNTDSVGDGRLRGRAAPR